MELFQTYSKEIISLIIPFLTWILNSFFKAKVNLQLSSPHTFTFLIPEPLYDQTGNQIKNAQTVETRSHFLINAGRETATKVELVFNWKPPFINIWPSRHFTEFTESDSRYIMIFESLAPNEHLQCELFSINLELPDLITVRSDQCIAKFVEVVPQEVFPPWQIVVARILLFLGSVFSIYLLILILQFLVLKTPFWYFK
ncbi:hypothetical protein [Leptospira brenneri]|uniref:hypothetical protein n=1 Tax=Leptospira brenneri TaxID=2023182 RepID=UPI000C2AAD61|nr:hypothetical protein [Leptospira brenneri]PJZ43755.1 hypothetical protein CH361_18555 [Leptospira brenneri]